MAHEYKAQAKESHAKKLKAYGADEKHTDKAKNWAGFDALNTNEQRGLKPIDKEPELSKETMPRIMRKKGGKVVGADSLKRLDKAPRGGARAGKIPTGTEQQLAYHKADPVARKKGGYVKKREDGGDITDPEAAMRSAERLREIRAKKRGDEGPTREEAETINRKQRYSIEDLGARKKGGKVSEIEWEHSKKDLEEDRKLAKKHKMPLEKWEESALDKKHDKQQSMEGLKKGGRAKRAEGGQLISDKDDGDGSSKRTSTRGKTTVNIMVGQPSMETPGMPGRNTAMQTPPIAGALPPGAGAPPPPPMPMGAGGPGGMPPMPPGGAPGGMPMMPPGGAPPMMRKDGGSVQVPYKKPGRKGDYPAMDFGSGGGFGRKQKKDAYGEKPVPYNKENY